MLWTNTTLQPEVHSAFSSLLRVCAAQNRGITPAGLSACDAILADEAEAASGISSASASYNYFEQDDT